jgi:hypothetical protein
VRRLASIRPNWRWVLIAIAALAFAALSGGGSAADAEGGRTPGDRSVAGGGPLGGLDFNLAVYTSSGTLKDDCDSLLDDFKCIVHPGDTFTVEVYLDALPALTDVDVDTIAGYTDMAVELDYSPGLTANTPTVNTIGTCEFDPEFYTSTGSVVWACLQSGNEVRYTNKLFQLTFTCPAFKSKETVTLVPGVTFLDDTYIIDENSNAWREAGPAETVVINCDNVFPWDVDTSGQVSVGDIFQVVQHFGEVKPTP